MIDCRLILDKRKLRKWVLCEIDAETREKLGAPLKDIIGHGMTVSIGEKYASKTQYNIGDRITLDETQLTYHAAGYFVYNTEILTVPTVKEVAINPLSLEHDGFYLEDNMFKILYRNIDKQINTLLLGPTGSGKTEVIQRIADKLGIACSVYDMGALHDPIAGLLGVHRLENGESIFDYAKFVSDVQKPGIIVLDELSRAPHSCLNILFPCLDSRRMLPVEIASSKGLRNVPIHAQCSFIATANVGVEYTGTSTIDKALLNRFFLVEMPYLQPDIETRLLVMRTGVDEKAASVIAKIANEIRAHYKNGKIAQSVSTRETIMVSELICDGWTPLEALTSCVLPLYDEGDREFVNKLIMSK